MAHYRTYSIEFKRAVVQQFLAGEISLLGLAKQHRVGRNLIRLWLVKYEAGEFNEEAAMAASLEEYEARIAMLERKVGQLTMENDVLKKTLPSSRSRSGGSSSIVAMPPAVTITPSSRLYRMVLLLSMPAWDWLTATPAPGFPSSVPFRSIILLLTLPNEPFCSWTPFEPLPLISLALTMTVEFRSARIPAPALPMICEFWDIPADAPLERYTPAPPAFRMVVFMSRASPTNPRKPSLLVP